MTDISTVRELAAFYDKFKIVFHAQGSLRFSFSDRTKLLPVTSGLLRVMNVLDSALFR